MPSTTNKPDAIALAFWRAIEVGEPREVEALLPRVADINARNEHGVTALMRAAQHGHARVVRMLLANGADANVIRNDKFTALSLAAFFGHTEVVRALMEHGADSKASTRSGTSPHMWATARTFKEVVDQLQGPALAQRKERAAMTRPAPAALKTQVSAPFVTPARSVPEPHEVPARTVPVIPEMPRVVPSMRLTFRLATAAVLVAACVVGVLILRGAQAHSEMNTEPRVATPVAAPNAGVKEQDDSPSREEVSPPVQTHAAAPAPLVPVPVKTAATDDFRAGTAATRSSHSRAVRAPRIEFEPVAPAAPVESVQRVEASSEKSDTKVRAESTPGVRSSAPLSPQLITPAKTDSPKKKVIQWP